jgi:hypothetical protein
MPLNVINVPYEIFSVVASILVLLGAALAFSFRHKSTHADAGEMGPRPEGAEEDTERVSPDGFIDTFAGRISEAGGGMPVIGWIIIGVTLVCYVGYLFLFWNPGR